MIRHIINMLLWGLPPTRWFPLRRSLLRAAGINLGKNTCFSGRAWIYGRGKISIGKNTWLSPGVVIFSHVDAQICIGERCDIGHGVEFVVGGHSIGPMSRRAGKGTALPITIGDGCWIGSRTLILGGVNIGSGCVVAAGAVVTKDVPPNSLIAGVPARIKRTLS